MEIRILSELVSNRLTSDSRSLVSLASLSIMGFALIKNRKGQHRAINTDRPINEEYTIAKFIDAFHPMIFEIKTKGEEERERE